MSKANASLADIVRMLRSDADIVEERHTEDAWTGSEVAGIYRDLADRIEAAAERLLAQKSQKVEPPGNTPAMREAVGNALWCLNWMDENTGDKPTKDHLAKPIELLTAALAAPPEPPPDSAKMREALEAVKVAFDSGTIGPVGNYPPARLVAKAGKVMEMVEKALAAPARNCDVGTTEEKN